MSFQVKDFDEHHGVACYRIAQRCFGSDFRSLLNSGDVCVRLPITRKMERRLMERSRRFKEEWDKYLQAQRIKGLLV